MNFNLREITSHVISLYKKNEIFKNDPNAPRLDNNLDALTDLFANYACVDFAHAVNKLTGWELYHLEFYQNKHQQYAPYHVLAKIPNSELYFDVNGITTLKSIVQRYSGDMEHLEVTQTRPVPFLVFGDDMKTLCRYAAYKLSETKSTFSI